jgi:hypothetical protein
MYANIKKNTSQPLSIIINRQKTISKSNVMKKLLYIWLKLREFYNMEQVVARVSIGI